MALALCTWTALLLGILYMFFSAFDVVYGPEGYGLCVRFLRAHRARGSSLTPPLLLEQRDADCRPHLHPHRYWHRSWSAVPPDLGSVRSPLAPFSRRLSVALPFLHVITNALTSFSHCTQLLPPESSATRPPPAARGAPPQRPLGRLPRPRLALLVRVHDVHERPLDRVPGASRVSLREESSGSADLDASPFPSLVNCVSNVVMRRLPRYPLASDSFGPSKPSLSVRLFGPSAPAVELTLLVPHDPCVRSQTSSMRSDLSRRARWLPIRRCGARSQPVSPARTLPLVVSCESRGPVR